MGSPKTLTLYGLLAKEEVTYGTAVVLAGATDGVDLIKRPSVVTDYMHQGERGGKSPASHGGRKRVGRMGRFATASIGIEPCGAGAAYAVAVLPNVHRWLQAGGFTPTVDATPGSESVTYAPHAVGAEKSLCAEAYERGQKYVIQGMYANTKLTFDAPGIPMFEFSAFGIQSDLPTDSAVPVITYPTVEPPKAEAVLLTIGDWVVGNIKNIEFNYERNISPRFLNNSTGLHGGFNVGVERKLTLKCLVEAVALDTAAPWSSATQYNPFASMEAGEQQAISFSVGGTQYEKFDFEANQAQLVSAPEQEDGAASTWELTYELKPSTLTANDECAIIFN